ncbi:hypothetical protein SAMN05216188_102264 [Lentzea xinjiangensis]|uniref:Uncharacterized protein n=1 Tax=Lentzea xinjiangensis TaxID=402600 RepID=A0A1H9DSJ7_9PSEU|nr:hypothetical protein [Lentzea xinjiangensis]SEQ16435.1 hypothetical protein SAMN05216188_102264 [Lentzea xinjiangensis]
MLRVVCQAVRWLDDEFPGTLEVRLTDAHGTVWSLVDKAPVFIDPSLTPEVVLPVDVEVACEVVRVDGESVTVSTARPWGVATADGFDEFRVTLHQLVDGATDDEVTVVSGRRDPSRGAEEPVAEA